MRSNGEKKKIGIPESYKDITEADAGLDLPEMKNLDPDLKNIILGHMNFSRQNAVFSNQTNLLIDNLQSIILDRVEFLKNKGAVNNEEREFIKSLLSEISEYLKFASTFGSVREKSLAQASTSISKYIQKTSE